MKSEPTAEDRFIKNFTPQLNRLLTSLLGSEKEYLLSTEVDVKPRVEAFWSLGGIEPDKTLRKVRENNKLHNKGDPAEPIDRCAVDVNHRPRNVQNLFFYPLQADAVLREAQPDPPPSESSPSFSGQEQRPER